MGKRKKHDKEDTTKTTGSKQSKKFKPSNDESSGSEASEDEFSMLGLEGAMLEKARLIQAKVKKCKDAEKKEKLSNKLVLLLALAAQKQKTNLSRIKPTVVPSNKISLKLPVTSGGAIKPMVMTAEEQRKRQERQQRFLNDSLAAPKEKQVLQEAGGIGKNTSLEKTYLRLTTLPTAQDVRPPRVLTAALALVKQKWKEEADYKYACEQLKSIRQDLTVQHIRNELTVQAYETHGRIALEVGDVAEFNQCLAVLKTLYSEGVTGNEEEFCAYGILYALVACGFKGGGAGQARQALMSELQLLSRRMLDHLAAPATPAPQHAQHTQQQELDAPSSDPGEKKNKKRRRKHDDVTSEGAVKHVRESQGIQPLQMTVEIHRRTVEESMVVHALHAVQAFRQGDWCTFIQLYSSAQRMVPYLMDRLLPAVRASAIQAIASAYRPVPVPLAFIQTSLGLEDLHETRTLLESQGCVVKVVQGQNVPPTGKQRGHPPVEVEYELDTKASAGSLRGVISS